MAPVVDSVGNPGKACCGAALQFELEANNFNLDDRGSYFDDGWVAEDDGAPGFFENLMSGGKLQRVLNEAPNTEWTSFGFRQYFWQQAISRASSV
jgi:hypothetical protein